MVRKYDFMPGKRQENLVFHFDVTYLCEKTKVLKIFDVSTHHNSDINMFNGDK